MYESHQNNKVDLNSINIYSVFKQMNYNCLLIFILVLTQVIVDILKAFLS